ncbi:hypothetical protein BDV97DRAFT_416895 [Delphinella strobiligena]|nr:hypothetical protein BDV97DRAFT_416895 [Delphinella strobiligena]
MLSYFEYCQRGQRIRYKLHTLYSKGMRPWKENHDELRAKIGLLAELHNSCSSFAIKVYEAEKDQIVRKFGQLPKKDVRGSDQGYSKKHFELLDAILHLLRKLGAMLYGDRWQDPEEGVTSFYRTIEEAHFKYVVQQTIRRIENTHQRAMVQQGGSGSGSGSGSIHVSRMVEKKCESAYTRSRSVRRPDFFSSFRAAAAAAASKAGHRRPSDSSDSDPHRDAPRCHSTENDLQNLGNPAMRLMSEGRVSVARSCKDSATNENDIYKDWPPKTLPDNLNLEENFELYPSELPSPDLRHSNRVPLVPSSKARG